MRHPSFPDDPDSEEAEVIPCHECLLDRHRLCPDADVGDHQDADDPDYALVEMYCCCGQEWTERQLTTAAEYAAYAREATQRYGDGNAGGTVEPPDDDQQHDHDPTEA